MYKLNTDLSDLFGYGKGNAQSIDLSTFQNAQQLNEQKRAAREAEENKKIAEVQKRIDEMPTILNPRDTPVVAAKLKEFSDWTGQNIKALTSGVPAVLSEFNQRKYGFKAEIEQNNQGYKNVQKIQALIDGTRGGKAAFYPESVDDKIDNIETSGEYGDYKVKTPIRLPDTTNTAYFQNIGKNEKALANQEGRQYNVSDKSAYNDIADVIKSDASRGYGEAIQATEGHKDTLPEETLNEYKWYSGFDDNGNGTNPISFSRDPEKLKEVDENGNRMYIEPTDVTLAQAKYARHIQRKDVKPAPQGKTKSGGDDSGKGAETKFFKFEAFEDGETQSVRLVSKPEAENKKVDIVVGDRAYEGKPLILGRRKNGDIILKASVDGRVMEFKITKDGETWANLRGHLARDPMDIIDGLYSKKTEAPKKKKLY